MGHVLILLLSKHRPALDSEPPHLHFEQNLDFIERLCLKSTLFPLSRDPALKAAPFFQEIQTGHALILLLTLLLVHPSYPASCRTRNLRFKTLSCPDSATLTRFKHLVGFFHPTGCVLNL